MTDERGSGGRGSGVVRLVIAWAYVGIPLAWGVSEVIRKSLALFR
jgi:hypothetical protein